MSKYDKAFYSRMVSNNGLPTNLTSAKEIVPFILKIFPDTHSIVDIGCGNGLWLNEFNKNGSVKRIYGVDGPWVTSDELLLQKKDFYIWNLEKKIHTKKKFDLAISLEVAEHISRKSADIFVENLTNLSDNIVFSAAIPNQGGTGHINEQWQSYWAEKFMDKGYTPYDVIRPAFHNNTKCRTEYVQNTIVYSKNKLDWNYLQTIINHQRGCEYKILDYRHPDTPIVKSSQSTKYLLGIQFKLVEAFVKKGLHAMNIKTKTV